MTKMVVFDMAGTTVNEDNVVYKTLQKAINKAGYDVSLDLVLEHGAGKEKLQAIQDIVRQVSESSDIDASSKAMFEDFLTMLKAAYDELDVQTFAGTVELFDYLHQKGVKVVLNTGYNKNTATKLLSKLNWQKGKEYDLLVTADDVENGRPHPDMILLAMQEMNIADPTEVIKIGDSTVDIQEGKAAKCGLTLGVTTGAQTSEQLKAANPNYIVDSLTYLKELV